MGYEGIISRTSRGNQLKNLKIEKESNDWGVGQARPQVVNLAGPASSLTCLKYTMKLLEGQWKSGKCNEM